jgi:hypothetical protein
VGGEFHFGKVRGSCLQEFFLTFGLIDASAGAYDEEEAAARAYDLAALKYWGPGTVINFKVLQESFFIYNFERFCCVCLSRVVCRSH